MFICFPSRDEGRVIYDSARDRIANTEAVATADGMRKGDKDDVKLPVPRLSLLEGVKTLVR